ncbi:MAG: glycosyltransferase [Firmicutes bacterium]|nr:glycosyltransferase [Bacillota bacterium]
MSEVIINGIFWVLAIYGLIEIIKTIINSFRYTNLRTDGIYIIIAAKDQEEQIEGFIRSFLSKLSNEKGYMPKNIIITDLDSKDKTDEILSKLKLEYENIKIMNWQECKELIDSMN